MNTSYKKAAPSEPQNQLLPSSQRTIKAALPHLSHETPSNHHNLPLPRRRIVTRDRPPTPRTVCGVDEFEDFAHALEMHEPARGERDAALDTVDFEAGGGGGGGGKHAFPADGTQPGV